MALFMNEVEEVEEARTIANSQIWNVCTVSGCRSIVVCIEKKIPSSAALSINGAFFFSLCDLHCKQYADYSYLALWTERTFFFCRNVGHCMSSMLFVVHLLKSTWS
jgi:hypothetical protein